MTNFDFDFEMPDECLRAAPALTAWFDGEASERDEILARVHLEKCTRCALSFRDWKQTRFLLRETPASKIPAGFLARILLACRLSTLPRKNSRPAEFGALSKFDVPARFDTDFNAPAPSFLADEILRRTVSQSSVVSRQLPVNAAPREKLVRPAFHPFARAQRVLASVAVPAMALWLCASAWQTSFLPGRDAAPTFTAGLRAPLKTAKFRVAPLAKTVAKTPTAPNLAPDTDAADFELLTALADAASAAPPAVKSPEAAPDKSAAPVPQIVPQSAPAPARIAAPAAKISSVSLRPVTRPANIENPVSLTSVNFAALPLTPASWTPEAHRNLRPATSVKPETPKIPEADDAADDNNFADHRPAAVRGAVDDFRAAVMDETPDDAPAKTDAED